MFSIFMSAILYSQKKEYNFIISVDNILTNVYANSFIIHTKDNNIKTINVNFVQGRISINDDDFKFLQSDNVLKVNLDIVKYDIIKNETKRNSYEIESFNLDWLTKGTFFILYIHTNKKNLKKFIEPFSNEKFIYEYDWSEGSMRRLRRK